MCNCAHTHRAEPGSDPETSSKTSLKEQDRMGVKARVGQNETGAEWGVSIAFHFTQVHNDAECNPAENQVLPVSQYKGNRH